MRRGEMVRTLATARTSPAELAELMVGRRVLLRVEKAPATPGPVVLEVDGLDLVDDKGVRAAEVGELRRCARARSSGSPGSPATASRSCSRCWPASGRRPAGRCGSTARRSTSRASPTPTTAARRRDRARARGPPPARAGHAVRRSGRTPASATSDEPRFQGPVVHARPRRRSATSRGGASSASTSGRRSCDLKTANFSGGNQQKIVHRPRDGARPRGAAGRPADPRRRHRRDRVHPPADRRAARPGQGDPAGLGRARRDPGARRPDRGDVRRPHLRRARRRRDRRARARAADGRDDRSAAGDQRRAAASSERSPLRHACPAGPTWR